VYVHVCVFFKRNVILVCLCVEVFVSENPFVISIGGNKLVFFTLVCNAWEYDTEN
jgi:hypothetical protein